MVNPLPASGERGGGYSPNHIGINELTRDDDRRVNLTIPDPSLVVLIGPSGSGKSTFAARHFRGTEVISSDQCRALVSDDENDQSATPAAFRLVHAIARERLRIRRVAVVDATNVRTESRKPLVALARRAGVEAVGIVFNLPEQLCLERSSARAHRPLPEGVVHRQYEQMQRSLPGLEGEGFQRIYFLDSAEDLDNAGISRQVAL